MVPYTQYCLPFHNLDRGSKVLTTLVSTEESRWEKLSPGGDCPPCLQEHSAVAYRECIYVFGGELGFSAGNETPLWIYNIKVRFKFIG